MSGTLGLRSFTSSPSPVMAAVLLVILSACAAVPSDGPQRTEIERGAMLNSAKGLTVVDVGPEVLSVLSTTKQVHASTSSGGLPAAKSRAEIGMGDRLVINIWENGQDGLFSSADKRSTSIQVVVDEEGRTYVPYVGRIVAASKTVEEVRGTIERGLVGKAVEPQVQVLLEQNEANAVVVVGDVSKPGQLLIPPGGLRLMQAIALSGGSRGPEYDTFATVTRKGRSETIYVGDTSLAPRSNIRLAPGDNVAVSYIPRSYSAFGAVRKSGLSRFNAKAISLAEALAQSGGLIDGRADAGGVFVFRFEDRLTVKRLSSMRPFASNAPGVFQVSSESNAVPVIYRFDMAQAKSFFFAQSFNMRDKDIVFVATHPTVEFDKFMTSIVLPILGTARGSVVLAE